VRVTAAAEGGRANDAVLSLLAETFDVPSSSMRLVSGRAGRDKIVEVTGIAPDESERRLAAAGEEGST
jgi:uncharacterized protein YggU (UPF0235/DUF167 family)